VNYNALSIGNHDFDLGPDVLADVIGATTGSYPFLAANLDFTNEPASRPSSKPAASRPARSSTTAASGSA
jgi:2',3'-cyclic-nucleotide 2'-phosphodiesterase (5'-nucleotidase family)